MSKIMDIQDLVSEKDVREFNKALMRMLLKLQEENDVLKDKVKHLEDLLLITKG